MLTFSQLAQAITVRKRCFLEKEEWKTIPWAKCPESKSPYQQIQDFVADVPGFFEDFVNIVTATAKSEDTTQQRKVLKRKVMTGIRGLIRWRWAYEKHQGVLAWENPVRLGKDLFTDGDEEPLFPMNLYYKDFEAAQTLTVYNQAVLGHIWQANALGIKEPMAAALTTLSACDRPTPVSPLALPSKDLTVARVVIEICRSIEYQLLEEHANIGSYSLMLPMRAW